MAYTRNSPDVTSPLPDFPEGIGSGRLDPIVFDLPDRISVRAATRSDFIFLRRLYAAGRKSELAAVGMPARDRQDFCDRQFACQHSDWVRRFPSAQFLILMRGIRPIGRLYLNPTDEGVHIVEIAFLPEWQGKGFGRAIIAWLQRQAAASVRNITLNVTMDNGQAASLYRRLGFVAERQTDRHIFMRWNAAAAIDSDGI